MTSMDAMGGLYPLRGGAILCRVMSATLPPGNPRPSAPVIEYTGPRDVSAMAVIGCRLLAIWMFAYGIYDLVNYLGSIVIYLIGDGGSLNWTESGLGLLGICAWIVLAWLCWFRALKLADWMLRGMSQQSSVQGGIEGNELFGIALMAIGAYLLADSLPRTAWLIYLTLRATVTQNFNTLVPGIFMSGGRCAIGLWFILGAPGIVRLLRRISDRVPTRATRGTDDPARRP